MLSTGSGVARHLNKGQRQQPARRGYSEAGGGHPSSGVPSAEMIGVEAYVRIEQGLG